MIKINKFLAASVVTLSLAACDLAPYSSIAVYAVRRLRLCVMRDTG